MERSKQGWTRFVSSELRAHQLPLSSAHYMEMTRIRGPSQRFDVAAGWRSCPTSRV